MTTQPPRPLSAAVRRLPVQLATLPLRFTALAAATLLTLAGCLAAGPLQEARSQSIPPPVRQQRAVDDHPAPTTLQGPHAEPGGHPRRINCAKRRCIALTFDDGPGPYTDQLLRTLAAHRARATFFVLGSRAQSYPKTLRRVVASGHEVGNHSFSHADLTRLSRRGVLRELRSTNRAVRRAAGIRPRVMRPPYGASNAVVGATARRLGMPQIRWSVDTYDWRDHDSHVVARRALAGARPGAVILMHDIHLTSVQAVDRLVTGLRRRGYTLVTVSELFGKVRPGASYSQR